jgi:hypothetical protein
MGYIDNELGLTAQHSNATHESFSSLSAGKISAEYSTCRLGCNIKHPTSRKKRKACFKVCIGTRDKQMAQLAAMQAEAEEIGLGIDTDEMETSTAGEGQGEGEGVNLQTKEFKTKTAGISAKNVAIGLAVLAVVGGAVYFIRKRN